MQAQIPMPRNLFDVSINLHCELQDVYRINNNVDVQLNAAFPKTAWSQTYMIIYVEKFLNNQWLICDASKKTIFKNFKGSTRSDLQPSNPGVKLDLNETNETLILTSDANAYQLHHVRFQMDIPKTNHGFKRGGSAYFRIVFVLVEEIWPVNQGGQIIPLQTKTSNVFDVINGGPNDKYNKQAVPAADNNSFQNVQVLPTAYNQESFVEQLALDTGYDNFPDFDFLPQDDAQMMFDGTLEHKPISAHNPLKDVGADDIIKKMEELVLNQKSNDKIAKALQDSFKFIVRRREQSRPTQQNNTTTVATAADIPKKIPVPVLSSGDTIEIILMNNLDNTCGFSVSGAVHVPGMPSLPFESTTTIEKNEQFYVVPHNGFIYSSLIATNKPGNEEDIVPLTLVTKIIMDDDKSEKFFVFKRRCVILSDNSDDV